MKTTHPKCPHFQIHTGMVLQWIDSHQVKADKSTHSTAMKSVRWQCSHTHTHTQTWTLASTAWWAWMSWGGNETLGGVAEASGSSCRTSKVNYWRGRKMDRANEQPGYTLRLARPHRSHWGQGLRPKRPNVNECENFKHDFLICFLIFF